MNILILLIVLWIFLIIGSFVCLNISDDRFIKQLKEEEIKANVAEARLTQSLQSICEQLGIPLTYHEQLGDAGGQILYHSDSSGRLILDNAHIEILNKYKDRPYVLAHELGHYMAIKQRNDRTEEGASREALILCKSILTQDEQELLHIALDVYFNGRTA